MTLEMGYPARETQLGLKPIPLDRGTTEGPDTVEHLIDSREAVQVDIEHRTASYNDRSCCILTVD